VSSSVGKLLYGVLFMVVLPGLLVLWAQRTSTIVQLPMPDGPGIGMSLAAVGLGHILAGWHALWTHGGGLPMNAFPPPRLVTRGVYAFTAHPIYVGFTIGASGVAIATRSASGLWLVTPAVALGAAALLWGYELHDLTARFGGNRPRSWLSLPAPDARAPTLRDRVSVYLTLLLPWGVLYEAVILLGVPSDAIESYLPFERSLPVLEASYPLYASVYWVVLLLPWLASSAVALRRFVIQGLVAGALAFPMHWFIPVAAVPREFVPVSFLGRALMFERGFDSAGGALPSLHVILAGLTAAALGQRFPRARVAWWLWAGLVSMACIGVGMHSIADVTAGVALCGLALRYDRTWALLSGGAEKVANSWREWRFGTIRVISHAGYGGLSSAVGMAIVVGVLGPRAAAPALIAASVGLLGAAAWAQWIEGSPDLLRPFGFYGGLVGTALGCLVGPAFGIEIWELLAAFALAGPFVQALGRLRCLVQGCCHGAPAPAWLGISYHHPRSRVVRLSPWAGQPVHATPLYSILTNCMLALVMVRLWSLQLPSTFVGGTYLVLSGLGRFVEEAYRGEAQTPIEKGLRLYQWTAVVSVVAGGLVTTLPAPSLTQPPHPSFAALASAVAMGVLTAIALGVDFPGSNRRFSRLV
jgi:prolipoprotein diacylglyceryltransferase/protein-S-isoprenylcysteine O-methyltransferase Ste14